MTSISPIAAPISIRSSPIAHRPAPSAQRPPPPACPRAAHRPFAYRSSPTTWPHRPLPMSPIIGDCCRPSEEGMRQFSWPQFRFTDKIPNETECNEPSSTPEIRVQSAAFLTEGCKFCMAARSSQLNPRFTFITTKQSCILIFSCVWVFEPSFTQDLSNRGPRAKKEFDTTRKQGREKGCNPDVLLLR